MTACVDFLSDRLRIRFKDWDRDEYALFLRSKKLPEHRLDYDHESDVYELTAPARFAPILGVDPPSRPGGKLPILPSLFDYQDFMVRRALEARRYAIWADTGLGKTPMGLEFSRQAAHRTGSRGLIISPLNIIEQWCDEARKFYDGGLELVKLASKAELRDFCEGAARDTCIGITNPEKFIPRRGEPERMSELSRLGSLALDEASLLKSGGGRIKWALVKSARGIEHKLSLTATPAPNDTMEYASQGSFLEKLRNEGEIIWTFFRREKSGEWKVKEHAREAFYRFMAGWSVYLRHPARYGFADNLKDLPEPEILVREIEPTAEQREAVRVVPDSAGQCRLFEPPSLGVVQRAKFSQLAKGFYYDGGKAVPVSSRKPEIVAGIVRDEVAAGRQVLVWTCFDAESDILAELLSDVDGLEVLTGKVPTARRPAIIERFRKGGAPAMITRARLLGHGLNFQNCTAMVFSGFDDSFEAFYQAVRRAYRYGQRSVVRVHIPYIRALEGVVWDNVQGKSAAFERDTEIMERCYCEAMKEVLGAA